MKPVQRRILYAMWANLKLTHEGRFRKSAAVIGEVMARFHPHGDQSIYDAMVRMAQPFSLRSPLVEGQGNFGSLDGDPPAAMRYTETRLQALAAELLSEIDQDTVPFRPNYDGTTIEPVVLPARFPHLLVHGAAGIAVGMATDIPPHNLREVCRAAVALLDRPDLDTSALCDDIEGPDFPGGGEVLNSRAELLSMYGNGKGSVRLRGTWMTERLPRRSQIVLTTIPYGVNKATLVAAIGQAIGGGKVPQLVDVRDESTDVIRIVLELRQDADPEVAVAWLVRHTDFERNVPVNMTALVPAEQGDVPEPARLGLKAILAWFLLFRRDTVRRRLEHVLGRLQTRIHVLAGFELVFDVLDEVIALIRGSDGKSDAARRLIARFAIDADQAEAILELKLYRLARLEIQEIRSELTHLRADAERIGATLGSQEALSGLIRVELLDVAKRHGNARRTRIVGPRTETTFDPDAYVIAEDTCVVLTRDGWFKRQRSVTDVAAIRVREGDAVSWVARASTRSTIAFFTDRGRAYVCRVDQIPQTTGYGEPIQRRFQFADGERLIGITSMDPRNLPSWEPEPEVEAAENTAGEGEDDGVSETSTVAEAVGPVAVAILRSGRGLRFPLRAHAEPSQRGGRRFASPGEDDAVVTAQSLHGPDDRLSLVSKTTRVSVFRASELKLLRGGGRGVLAMRLSEGDTVIAASVAQTPEEGVALSTSRGRNVVVSEKEFGLSHRGGKGSELLKRGTITVAPPTLVNLLPKARPGGEDNGSGLASSPHLFRVPDPERDDG